MIEERILPNLTIFYPNMFYISAYLSTPLSSLFRSSKFHFVFPPSSVIFTPNCFYVAPSIKVRRNLQTTNMEHGTRNIKTKCKQASVPERELPVCYAKGLICREEILVELHQ